MELQRAVMMGLLPGRCQSGAKPRVKSDLLHTLSCHWVAFSPLGNRHYLRSPQISVQRAVTEPTLGTLVGERRSPLPQPPIVFPARAQPCTPALYFKLCFVKC